MRLWMIGIALGIVGTAQPAAAQVVCRPNTLGTSICMGGSATAPRATFQPPLARSESGRVGVGRPPLGGLSLVPARRTDVLGNTVLEPRDLPPPRSPPGLEPSTTCRPDALGNLICR